jgi:demethylmenaquinone methyltransferase / 2-methoxy-6-polyprenyl-1,4-benzoquinol methylase
MTIQRTGSPRNRFARSLFEPLPSRYDTLAYLLSFGQDRRWRAAVVDQVARSAPATVLDVACGPAGVALAIADATRARIVGVDLTEEMLRQGLRNVRRVGRSERVKLAIAQAEALPFADDAFDAVSFSYLLRYVDDPPATIAEIARCAKPGATVACLEFHVPRWKPAHVVWWFYTRLILPLLGFLTGGLAWYRVGRFLGPSITDHYTRFPVAAHVEAWRRAGLRDIGVRYMSFGGGVVMWGKKKAADDA